MEGADDPVFQITVEVLYHGSRQAFLSGAHRWMMFGTIVFGASAAASFWGEKACALLAAATGGADLAFDFVGRAQAHADIRRRYYALGERRQCGDLTDEQFGVEWMLISPDEPPLFRWAELIAYRNACLALGRAVPDPLPWWQRLLAHVWRG